MSPNYWKRLRARRLERSRKGVEARARKHAARHAGEPVRAWKLVRRITDEAPWRCRRVIAIFAMDIGDGRSRIRVMENGAACRAIRSQGGAIRALVAG